MHSVRSHASTLAALLAAAALAALHSGCSQGDRTARLLDTAHRYLDAGEFEKAEIEYKNVLQKSPQNTDAITRLGLLYQEQGRDGRAAVFLQQARDLQPDNLPIRRKLALALLGSGNGPEARKEALFILEHRPDDDLAPLVLAETSANAAEQQDAQLRLLALNPERARLPSVLVALGNLALRQNRTQEAGAYFRAALELDPQSAAAHGALALFHWGAQEFDAAAAAFHRAAELSPPRSPRQLHLAQFRRQRGDVAGARALITTLNRTVPDYLPPWIWLADLALEEKQLDEADAFAAKALAREPLHPEALLLSARIKLARGESAKAADELERMLTYFPRSVPVAYQLGLAHAAAGDTAKAIARLTALTAAAPDFTAAAVTLAELHLRKRDFGAALGILRPLTRQRPDHVGARVLLAEAHRGLGNLDETAALYAELARAFPQEAPVAFAHGLVLLQQNQIPAARAEFTRVRTLQPDHLPALEQLVELDLRERRPADARQRLAPVLEKDSGSAALAFLHAKVCAAAADLTGLEAALQRTLELDPTHPAANYQLARLYVETKRVDTAIAGFRAAAQTNPKSFSPRLLLAVLLDEQRDYAGARAAYEEALALEPKNNLALNNLAYLCLERFDAPDRALELAQRARQQQPLDPRVADTFGWALVKKKNYPQAVGVLQESASRLPDEPDVHYHLGVAHYHLGDETAALAALERALTLRPNFAAAEDARQRVALLQLTDTSPATRALVAQRLAAQPEDPVAQLRRAQATLADGDAAQARTQLQALLKLAPRHPLALIHLAELHAAGNRLPAALEAAKAARAAAPGSPSIAHRVGRVALAAGDHRWASSLLQDAAKALPGRAEVLADWAHAAFAVGRIADAESAFQRAVELDAGAAHAAAWRRSATLLAASAEPARAAALRAEIDAALQAAPHDGPALFAAARARESTERAAARGDYEALLQRFPEFTPGQRHLVVLTALTHPEVARLGALAAKARQALPRDRELTRAAGFVAYRAHEYTKAIGMLQEFGGDMAADSEALYYLGMAQWHARRLPESRRTLQRALDLGLTEALAAEARKRLAGAE